MMSSASYCVARELREAHVPAELAAQGELPLQVRGRRFAIGLVRGIDAAAERGLAAQALIEGDASALGPHLLEEIAR